MKTLMYKQIFTIGQSNPDPTAYNQQRQIWYPENAQVSIELEVTKENFILDSKFFEEIKLAELGQGDWPKVPELLTYTPLGWSKVMEQLEAPYKSFEAEVSEDGDDDLWDGETY